MTVDEVALRGTASTLVGWRYPEGYGVGKEAHCKRILEEIEETSAHKIANVSC